MTELDNREREQIQELRSILTSASIQTWKPDYLDPNRFYANIDSLDCLITVEVSRRLP